MADNIVHQDADNGKSRVRFAIFDTSWLTETEQPLTGREIRTLTAIASFADWNKHGLAFPGRERIATVAGLEPREVSASLPALERERLLTVIRRRNNVYFAPAKGFYPEPMPMGDPVEALLCLHRQGIRLSNAANVQSLVSGTPNHSFLRENPLWMVVLEEIFGKMPDFKLNCAFRRSILILKSRTRLDPA